MRFPQRPPTSTWARRSRAPAAHSLKVELKDAQGKTLVTTTTQGPFFSRQGAARHLRPDSLAARSDRAAPPGRSSGQRGNHRRDGSTFPWAPSSPTPASVAVQRSSRKTASVHLTGRTGSRSEVRLGRKQTPKLRRGVTQHVAERRERCGGLGAEPTRARRALPDRR